MNLTLGIIYTLLAGVNLFLFCVIGRVWFLVSTLLFGIASALYFIAYSLT